MPWTDRSVREALDLPGGRDDRAYSSITTDSRGLGAAALFVALTGERFDGHDFLGPAAAAGATGAVVRRGTAAVPGLELYPVDDPLRAYGLLARARRRAVTGPVVAVTGTNGKTSTKEMIAAVLRTRFRVHATRLNLNNLVGVPQTILEAPPETDAMVVEAGANLPGEIARHREIIEPSIAVVTNVAAGHLEGFGSLDGVREEKLALVAGAPLAIVGTEPASLADGARKLARRVVTAGLEAADVSPTGWAIDADGRARITIDGTSFTVGLLGAHQASNAVLAWAVGRELGLEADAMAAALTGATVPGGRGRLSHHGRLTILEDCYNANPSSFRAAIDLARSLRGRRRLVFVAGTMGELGAQAERFHREIAEALVDLEPDLLAAVGDFGPALARFRDRLGSRLVVAPDAAAIGPLVAARLDGSELVVLKASRSVALERIIPDLLARTSPGALA